MNMVINIIHLYVKTEKMLGKNRLLVTVTAMAPPCDKFEQFTIHSFQNTDC